MKKNILALSVATAVVDMTWERPAIRTIGPGATMCAPALFGHFKKITISSFHKNLPPMILIHSPA